MWYLKCSRNSSPWLKGKAITKLKFSKWMVEANMSNDFGKFYDQQEILHEVVPPYTP